MPKRCRGKRDREEKCKAVIFPTAVSALLLSALLGCEKLKKGITGWRKKKDPSVNDTTAHDGESEGGKESVGKRGQPLYSQV